MSDPVSSDAKSICQCDLRRQLRHVGVSAEEIELLLSMIDDRTSEWDRFAVHMMIEENYILPHLPQEESARILSEHEQFRTSHQLNGLVPSEMLMKHARREVGLTGAD